MKIIQKYTTLALVASSITLVTSCEKLLDTPPDNRTELDTPQKIKKLLVSAYPTVSTFYLTEMASDNADDNGGNWQAYDIFQSEAFNWIDGSEIANDNTYEIWNEHYTTIATANAALEAIEKAGNPASLDGVRGEALLCRAYGHFVLVNIFSKAYHPERSKTDLGIPYSKIVESDLIVKHDRGTVAQVYEEIAADLEVGLPLINDNTYEKPKYHFNRKAAYGLASRFYLYYRQYDKAIAAANIALGKDPTSTLRDWYALSKLSANGFIVPNQYINQDVPANFLLMTAGSSWGYVHGPYKRGTKFTYNNTIHTTEAMGATTAFGTGALINLRALNYDSATKKMVVRKIGGYFEFTDPVNQIGYTRIVQAIVTADEVLLNRAEAYAQKDKLDEAYNDLLTFYRNFGIMHVSGPPSKQKFIDFYKGLAYHTPTQPTLKKRFHIDYALSEDQEAFLQGLLHFRRSLTMHEGHRWHDAKRYGITLHRRLVFNNDIKVMDTMEANDERRAFQIPTPIIGAGITPNPR